MSEENVEAFKRSFEAGNRHDFDAMLEELDPAVEWHPAVGVGLAGEATVLRGREEVRKWFQDLFEAFDDLRFEASEFRDLGDELLAFGRVHAHGTGSGVEIDSPLAWLVRAKNGKAIWVRSYFDPKEALEAAGLSESAMSKENAGIVRGVRLPLAVSSGTRPRSLSERILIRAPALFRALALLWSRLPTSSRLRRSLTRRNLRQTYEAANRRDFEVLVLRMHPELEFRFDETPLRSMAPPDLIGVHHGPDAYVRVWRAGIESSEDYRVEPEEVIDLGDRLLVVGRQRGHGTGSGIPFDEPLLTLFTLRRGLVTGLQDFAERESALEAAGLRE